MLNPFCHQVIKSLNTVIMISSNRPMVTWMFISKAINIQEISMQKQDMPFTSSINIHCKHIPIDETSTFNKWPFSAHQTNFASKHWLIDFFSFQQKFIWASWTSTKNKPCKTVWISKGDASNSNRSVHKGVHLRWRDSTHHIHRQVATEYERKFISQRSHGQIE